MNTMSEMYNPDDPVLTLDQLTAARKVVQNSGRCIRTEMTRGDSKNFPLPPTVELFLKMEANQNSGSFKVRGITNQLYHLPPDAGSNSRKLITMSAGNYGRAFAEACKEKKLKGLVLLPTKTPSGRVEIIKGLGLEVEQHDSSELQNRVDEYVKERNMHFLHPFDDLHLIAGHASLGFEILEDLPDADIVLVCCGGGGLLAGISSALKLSGNVNCRVYGVEPEGSNTMWESFRQGIPVKKPSACSIASGLSPPYAGPNAFRHCQKFVEDILLVTDEELLDAVARLYGAGITVEPSGAAAMAALLTGKVPNVDDKKICVVLTGRNISEKELVDVKERWDNIRSKEAAV